MWADWVRIRVGCGGEWTMTSAWIGRHIQKAAEYQSEFNVLEPQGFRLLDLNGYSINGVDHFATVWEQSPGPAWIARHDQTSQQHNGLFDTLPDEGFRPIAVSGYDKGGEARFASLWQQLNGVDVHAKHGMTGAELQAEFNALDGTGFRPVDINGYTVAGQVRFAAIWDRSACRVPSCPPRRRRRTLPYGHAAPFPAPRPW